MRRRAFVTTTVAAIATATAGCIDRLVGTSYQQCTEAFVPLREIPQSIHTEVETAVADGSYSAITLDYPDLVSDDTTLWVIDDNRYYTHRVETGLLTDELIFEETTPRRTDSGELKLSNQTSETVAVTVRISADDDVLVDADHSVEPADDVVEVDEIANSEYAGDKSAVDALPGVDFPTELREYRVEIVSETAADEHSETVTIDTHPWFEFYWVQITDDGMLTGSLWENDTGFYSDEPNHSKVGVHWACTEPPAGWPAERHE